MSALGIKVNPSLWNSPNYHIFKSRQNILLWKTALPRLQLTSRFLKNIRIYEDIWRDDGYRNISKSIMYLWRCYCGADQADCFVVEPSDPVLRWMKVDQCLHVDNRQSKWPSAVFEQIRRPDWLCYHCNHEHDGPGPILGYIKVLEYKMVAIRRHFW